jgi:pimeloyl-ACP methyl ester carboxylesterase
VVKRVRRKFVDLAEGQVHVRQVSGPTERPPLFCLHQSPASSLTYAELLPHIERLAVAIDTPGFGESFRPQARPDVARYAAWIADVADAMGYARIDAMGLFTGAAIAAELAAARPDLVRRVVLAGPPLFTAEQQAGFLDNAWPVPPQPDGSHLMCEWQRTMSRPMPVPFERRVDAFNEYYRGGAHAIWGEQAVAVYPLADTLPRIAQPTLILEPDGIHGDCRGAMALLPNARIILIACLGYAMMQAVPEEVAAAVNSFLDEGDTP